MKFRNAICCSFFFAWRQNVALLLVRLLERNPRVVNCIAMCGTPLLSIPLKVDLIILKATCIFDISRYKQKVCLVKLLFIVSDMNLVASNPSTF